MPQVVAGELSTGARSLAGAIKTAFGSPTARLAIIAIIVADAIVLGLYTAWAAAEHYQLEHSYFYHKRFFSSADESLMEDVGYLKEFASVVMLGLIGWKRRSILFAALAFFVLVMLADDSLRFHEMLGAALASRGLEVPISQAIAALIEGVLPIALVAVAWVRAKSAERAVANAVLICLAILLFFAVGMDTVHEFINQITPRHGKIFALFEDGGELLSLTLLVAVIAGVLLRVANPAHSNAALGEQGFG